MGLTKHSLHVPRVHAIDRRARVLDPMSGPHSTVGFFVHEHFGQNRVRSNCLKLYSCSARYDAWWARAPRLDGENYSLDLSLPSFVSMNARISSLMLRMMSHSDL